MKTDHSNHTRDQEDREIWIFQGAYHFREKSKGKATSLTVRIALQFCAELARSFLLLLPLVFLAMFLLLWPAYSEAHRRILTSDPEKDGTYSQNVIQDRYISACLADEQLPEAFISRAQYFFMHLFQKGHWLEACFPGVQKTGEEKTVYIYHSLKRESRCFLVLIGLLVLADLIRMLQFLRHHERLDETVIRPIRDMTDMAATISANNLSNRINVEGTKNELRDLAVVINSMLDRIEVSYESQKQFVSDASHELRTPIAVIQGYADMLSRWGRDDPQVLTEGLEAISQEATNMKDLVEDLLFLARHDKKTLMMEISVFDPVDLLQEIIREAELVTPSDTFRLEPAEHLTLQADRNMIKQVIRILLDNAVKYTPDGGMITMGCQKKEGICLLTMRDTGDGISAEDLPHIFDRFYRADKARKAETGGHGLGLSIARIIVVAHGGRIRVRSKLQEGTVFTIELPMEQNASGEKTIQETEHRPRVSYRFRRKNNEKNEQDEEEP